MLQHREGPTNLEIERKRAQVSSDQLAKILHLGTESLEQFKSTQAVFEEDPVLKFNPATLEAPVDQGIALLAKRNIRLARFIKNSQDPWSEHYISCIVDLPASSSVHSGVCVPYLKLLANDQQLAEWLPKADSLEIVLCYCSAELASGADLNYVETEATYDPKTEGFILHTPNAGASKWWVGDSGSKATHAIVFARLLVNGKFEGVHGFLVPLRASDMKTLLNGIIPGDIETKETGSVSDNGFVQFNKVSIPKNSMLSRYQKIVNGEILPTANKTELLSKKLKTRAGIVLELGLLLAQASTIAVRFGLVQDRFYETRNGTIQMKNLDFQIAMQKVLPHVCSSYVMLLAWQDLRLMIEQNLLNPLSTKKGASSQSPQLIKAITNGFKDLSFRRANLGVEELRESCGTIGLSGYAGLNQILKKISTYPVFGFDQITRTSATVKFLREIQAKSPQLGQETYESIYTRFLKNGSRTLLLEDLNLLEDQSSLLNLLEYRVVPLLNELTQQQGTADKAEHVLSDAFVETFMMRGYLRRSQKVHHSDQRTLECLKSVAVVFALGSIINNFADFVRFSILPHSSLGKCKQVYEKHLQSIRQHSVALVDAFSFSDNSLKSAIGCYSGRAYETLYDWTAHKNPINSRQTQEDIAEFMSKTRPRL